jgi:hypothetical protein
MSDSLSDWALCSRDRTQVLSVHKLRRTARKQEREWQKLLEHYGTLPARRVDSEANGLPAWARGVRVEKAGPFQWAVVATGHRGR